MTFEIAALGDPAFDEIDFLGLERFAAIGGRHFFHRIGRRDSMNELAFVGLAWDERAWLALFAMEAFERVETEIGLPFVAIGAVTEEAIVAEDRADIAIENNRLIGRADRGEDGSERKSHD